MVSIKTILTLGALAVGATLFFGLGGASGIGTRIGSTVGGGLRTFGESLTESFTGNLLGVLNPFADSGGNEPAPSPTRPEPTCGPGTIENALGVCVAAEVPKGEKPLVDSVSQPTPDPFRTRPQIVPIFREGALTKTIGIQRSIVGGEIIEKVFASTLGRVAATPERVTLIGRSGRKAIVTPATAERLRLRGFTDL